VSFLRARYCTSQPIRTYTATERLLTLFRCPIPRNLPYRDNSSDYVAALTCRGERAAHACACLSLSLSLCVYVCVCVCVRDRDSPRTLNRKWNAIRGALKLRRAALREVIAYCATLSVFLRVRIFEMRSPRTSLHAADQREAQNGNATLIEVFIFKKLGCTSFTYASCVYVYPYVRARFRARNGELIKSLLL